MTTENEVCSGCDAINYIASQKIMGLEAIGQMRSDHQFARHARQMDLFDYERPVMQIDFPTEEAAKEFTNAFRDIQKKPGDRSFVHAVEGDEQEAAKTGLNKAMAKVERGIDPEFQRFAREILVEQAAGKPFITSDDIWERMPEHLDRDHYREPRHMSTIIKWGVRGRIIEKNQQYVPSKSPKGHMGPHNEWRSLIFEGGHDGD